MSPWTWTPVGSGLNCWDLTTPSGNIRAVIEREGDGWRPYIPGRGRCTWADDIPAALAIVRAILGADVPEVPIAP